MACCYAQMGQAEAALTCLEAVLENGAAPARARSGLWDPRLWRPPQPHALPRAPNGLVTASTAQGAALPGCRPATTPSFASVGLCPALRLPSVPLTYSVFRLKQALTTSRRCSPTRTWPPSRVPSCSSWSTSERAPWERAWLGVSERLGCFDGRKLAAAVCCHARGGSRPPYKPRGMLAARAAGTPASARA